MTENLIIKNNFMQKFSWMEEFTIKDGIRLMKLLICILSFTFGGMLFGLAFFQETNHPIMALAMGVIFHYTYNTVYLEFIDSFDEDTEEKEEGDIKITR